MEWNHSIRFVAAKRQRQGILLSCATLWTLDEIGQAPNLIFLVHHEY
jgi:hypothetical protein